MAEIECHCAKCGITDKHKLCFSEAGRGPDGCPTKREEKILGEALGEYDQPEVQEFARVASIQEGACYVERDARPFVMIPTKTRLEELIEFCQRMHYRRLGLVFCAGFSHEASLLTNILEKHDFHVVSVCCKVGRVAKERIGIHDSEKVRIGVFEAMCNPIAQAELLNEARTDFNVMMGLCIGHDSLFLKYVRGLTTVFAVKDRVTGHNPLAPLYTSNSYYRRLLGK